VPIAALAVVFIGWREGYLILAGILLFLILPLVFLLLRSRPRPGQHADEADIDNLGEAAGGTAVVAKGSANPNIGLSLGQACKTGLFWRLALGFFI
jgi:hypothetical protein